MSDDKESDLASWSTEDGDKAWIVGYDGRLRIHPLDLRDDEIDIDDIAAGLSCRARWDGRTFEFFSVAQHCVLGSLQFSEPLIALRFLLHDVEEAFPPGDLPRPIKHHPLLAPLVANSATIRERVFRHYGLDPVLGPDIKEVDNRMMATEKRDLFRSKAVQWTVHHEPYPEKIVPWSPREARLAFIEAFHSYRTAISGSKRAARRRFWR